MSLSCECSFDGDGECDWYWWPPKDYTTYTKFRASKCCCEHCDNMVKLGNVTGEVTRSRQGTEWEHDHGIADMDEPDAVDLASAFMCERCAALYFSFDDLGFHCVSPYESMMDLLKDYHATYNKTESKDD